MTVTTEVSKTTRDFVGTTRRLLIDGQWVEAALAAEPDRPPLPDR